jgi:hypothetical protein
MLSGDWQFLNYPEISVSAILCQAVIVTHMVESPLWPSSVNRPDGRLRSATVAQMAGLGRRRATAVGRQHLFSRNRSLPLPADWPPAPAAVPADERRGL